MKIRFFGTKLRWVVFLLLVWWGLPFLPGGAASAFAEAGSGAGIGTGAIPGGFFADSAGLPALPEYSGETPAGTSLRGGTGICETAVANANAGHQLPSGLLNAIAVVESGRLDPQTGSVKPWPWTIDANGTGYVYGSEQSAIQAAAGFEAAGISSLDIGCLQVNLAQHPDAFQSLAQAFDPAANANYAAAFLTSLEQKFGNWPQAVAAYHSQTLSLGEPYAAKVYAAWQGGGTSAAAPMALAAVANHAVTASIMQSAFAMTSLIAPMARLLRPDKVPSGRGLAAYRAAPVAIATSTLPQG